MVDSDDGEDVYSDIDESSQPTQGQIQGLSYTNKFCLGTKLWLMLTWWHFDDVIPNSKMFLSMHSRSCRVCFGSHFL